MECISLGPAIVADDIDEIVADERWVEILEYVSVDVSESAVRAVFVAVVERSQYPALEIWSRVGGGASVTALIGDQDIVHNHGPEAAVARAPRHIPTLLIVIPFRGG